MGRYPDRRLAGTQQLGRPANWQQPNEDPAAGCPGAWYRTAYIDSLYPYLRRRDRNGGRVANPRFDTADWQIQAAVMVLEAEQERWHAYVEKTHWDRAEARAEAERAKGRSRSR